MTALRPDQRNQYLVCVSVFKAGTRLHNRLYRKTFRDHNVQFWPRCLLLFGLTSGSMAGARARCWCLPPGAQKPRCQVIPPEAILGTRTGCQWLAGSIAKWLNFYLGAQAPFSITR